LNSAKSWICINGKSCLKLGDVIGNKLEKDFGMRLPCMAIFLLLQENKCRFHKRKRGERGGAVA
jgi:hypothetical protein